MKPSKKRNRVVLFSGLVTLILLVFLAGWFSLQMLDLSKSLDQSTKPENPRDQKTQTPVPVVSKKIPAITDSIGPPPSQQTEEKTAEPAQVGVPDQKVSGTYEPGMQMEPTIVKDPPTEPKPEATLEVQATAKIDAPADVDRKVEKPIKKALYSVQSGAFLIKSNAEGRMFRLRRLGYEPYIYTTTDAKKRQWYTVRIGDYEELEKAKEALAVYRMNSVFPAVITHIDSLEPVKTADSTPRPIG